MKRFLSILLAAFMLLSCTAFALDDYVKSPNAEPSTDDYIDAPADPTPGEDSPQTGIIPVAAIAGAVVLGLGGAGVVAFRKKES